MEASSHSLAADPERLLIIGTGENRRPDLSFVYKSIAESGNADLITLTQQEVRKPAKALKQVDPASYSHVLVDIPFKYLRTMASTLRHYPGLVIYEEDACQNFIADSKWRGRFERLYRLLPQASFAVTGHQVAEQLRNSGLNAHFIPKGFNERQLGNDELVRDISAGFIGRVKSNVYAERAHFLDSLANSHGVSLLRTNSPDQYRETLNRIGIFVSADIGLGEYMAKNFEAMACGCALLAYRQGSGEEEALGLRDMENVALYSNLDEARKKLELLQKDENLRAEIARDGQRLAWKNHKYTDIAKRLNKLIATTPATAAPPLPFRDRLKLRLNPL